MDVIDYKKIFDFVRKHADARTALGAWKTEADDAVWKSPMDIKRMYPKASIINARHVVFNILGNRYRLHVKVAFNTGKVLVKNIGTHKEYERWTYDD